MRTAIPNTLQRTANIARRWPATGIAVLWAAIGLGLTGGFPLAAQEPEAAIPTNDVVAAEVLARISEMLQAAESGQLEDEAAAATNGSPRIVGPPQTGGQLAPPDRSDNTNRSQADDRRSRSRRFSRSKSDQSRSGASTADSSRNAERAPTSAFSGTNNGLASLDYSAFRIIVDRNIFDPNRYPRRPGEPRVPSAPKPVDSLTLVGTMSYERGEFAFFDGSQPEYKKALKLTDVIAGYKVTNIAPNRVRLLAGTNELELSVGMQLRREEDGPWRLAGQSDAYAAASAPTSTNAVAAATGSPTAAAPASSEAESEIIKRLMQRREQE